MLDRADTYPVNLQSDIPERLERQRFGTALNHFTQACSALERREWESANAQVRSFVESLFEEVARLLLSSTKTGGAARKALEEAGRLRSREAALVKSFMDVAGGSGSHAGVSSEDEAKGRFLAGMGIGLMALALVPELTRVEDVIIGQLSASPGTRLPNDAEVSTECPVCAEKQFLASASINRDGRETVYTCRNGCAPLVVVGFPGDSPWPGRGYRLGPHVIRNARDLRLPVFSLESLLMTPKEIVIPASPAALMKRRPPA